MRFYNLEGEVYTITSFSQILRVMIVFPLPCRVNPQLPKISSTEPFGLLSFSFLFSFLTVFVGFIRFFVA